MAATTNMIRQADPAIDALVRGEHGDPFAVLGAHRFGESGVTLRSFQPQATQVWVLDRESGRTIGEMSRVHVDGLFQIDLPHRRPFAYRLRIQEGPATHELDDPYSFPTILGDLDVHLIAEGRHLRIYEKLGAHPMTLDGIEGVGFLVWAPSASRASVVGDFNCWVGRRHPLRMRVECGVW